MKSSSDASIVPTSLSSFFIIVLLDYLFHWLVGFLVFSSLPVEGLLQIPSHPGLAISFLSVKHQMSYLKHCEHGQKLNCWVLLGLMKGHVILVDGKLHVSVSGNFFSGATSFLYKMIFQSAARKIQERDICLDAGLPRQ